MTTVPNEDSTQLKMRQGDRGNSTLDYAAGSYRRTRAIDVLVLLMPLWCGIVIALAYWPVRHHDDEFWFAAMGLPFVVFLGYAFRRRWAFAWYCLAVGFVVTAIGFALPNFIR
jgi:hypothetical protein